MGIIDQLIGILSALVLSVGALVSFLFPLPPVEPLALEPAQEEVAVSEFPEAPEEKQVDGQNSLVEPTETATRGLLEQQPSSSPIQTKPTKPELQVNEETRAALVNILCTSQRGINGLSGSGTVIDSRGIILTNAHVAQYFLLRDYLFPNNIQCVVRTGSPAEPRYEAEILYLPPAWITANASQIGSAASTGTGEHDYAFLRITKRTSSEPLPASFPTLKMDRSYVDVGESMLLASYPAGFLGGETIAKSLYASSAIAYVTQLFTFSDNRNKVDLFSIGGTVVSQGGSSGGAAVRLQDGSLAGVITLATVADSTGKRDLRALALSHIDESMAAQGQGGITTLLLGDAAAKAATFNAQTAPTLRQQLLNSLPQ